jgi:RNA polymerase sigma-70 factor (ECF subfamily)
MNSQVVSVVSDLELTQLLSQVARGDRAAFAALYKHTCAKLYGVIARILFRSDPRDVLQDTYLSIWRRAGDFDPGQGSPRGWMTTIARNRAIDELRRVRPLALEDIPGFDPPAEEIDPLGSLDRSERLRALLRCLLQLDAAKRELVLFAYYRGASREALSKHFGVSAPTIKSRLRRGLAELKNSLADLSLENDLTQRNARGG